MDSKLKLLSKVTNKHDRKFYHFIISTILISIIHLIAPTKAEAQNCGCDFTIPLNQLMADGNTMRVFPGAVVCIQAGTRRYLRLSNFNGTRERPIIFKNCGGQAVIQNHDFHYGIRIDRSRHFRVTGTGDSRFRHGIKIARTGNNANCLQIGDLSSDFEVEFIEAERCGFAGIMAKTDPRCDGSSNRGNFVMRNVSIHDNLLHNLEGEAIYVGNSFYSGRNTTCNGRQVTLLPHDIIGLRVYNNIVRNTGWDGIQVGCASQDTEIYNNRIENYGLKGNMIHANGVQIGEGTTGKLYNNIIQNGRGNGIIMLGLGNNTVYNNIIINPGELGIFCDDRVTINGSQIAFINNTIINPRTDGIRIFSRVTRNRFHNNIITNPGGQFVNRRNHTNWTESHNIFTRNINELNLENPGGNNFRPRAGSRVIDTGMDVSSFGVTFDFDNNRRPMGRGYDIGAFEFATALEATFSVTRHALCHNSATGIAVANAQGGSPPYTYQWSNGVTTAENNSLTAGNHTVTVRDSRGTTRSGNVTINQPSEIQISGTVQNETNGLKNGQIELSINGGVEPYHVFWHQPPHSNQRILGELAAGNFQATITDRNNCKRVGHFTIENIFQEISFRGLNLLSTDNSFLAALRNGAVIDLAKLPTNKFKIEAKTSVAPEGSILISFNHTSSETGLRQVENIENALAWTPALGKYSITALAFAQPNGQGEVLATYTIDIEVISSEPLSFKEDLFYYSVYPNPFDDRIVIDMLKNIQGEVSVTLVDLNGKILYQKKEFPIEGQTVIILDLTSTPIPPGVYILNTQTQNRKGRSLRIVKN
jgi:hypothetical protein